MKWYYSDGSNRLGPISQEQFDELVGNGTITGDTLVWHADLSEWQPYSTLGESAPQANQMRDRVCRECQRTFPKEQLIEIRKSFVCAECKPKFLQKVQEGLVGAGQFEYAGFGIRFGAKFIDSIILWIIGFAATAAAGALSFAIVGNKFGTLLVIISQLLNMGIGIAYVTFFIGKFQATPGKMACGIIVVEPDGSQVSYLKAFGRYFGELVSAITMCIGYLMIAFDDERRALHDRICKTRVIKKIK